MQSNEEKNGIPSFIKFVGASPNTVLDFLSKCKNDIRSFSQELGEGQFLSFQWSKIRLRATRDAKAIELVSQLVKGVNSSGTPKMEVKELKSTGLFKAFEKVL